MTLSNPPERSQVEDILSGMGLFSPHSWLYKFGLGNFGNAYADNFGNAYADAYAFAEANAPTYALAYADVNADAWVADDYVNVNAYANADAYADVNADAWVADDEDGQPIINNPMHLPEKYTQEEREKQVLDLIVKTILEKL